MTISLGKMFIQIKDRFEKGFWMHLALLFVVLFIHLWLVFISNKNKNNNSDFFSFISSCTVKKEISISIIISNLPL